MIIAVITAGLFLTGCGADENHKSQDTTTKEIVKQNKVAVKNTAKTENTEKKSTWQKVKEKAAETAKKTKEATQKVVATTKEKAKEFDQEHNVTGRTKAAVVTVKEKTKEVVAKVTGPNPETLYKKCAGCHGAKAQNHALGKSKIIHNFTAKQISTALHGYQNGTYGGAMKAVMAGQAKNLSDKDISALAGYIPTLK